jgi:CHRD domain
MYFHIPSSHLTLCLIIAFAILCAPAALAFGTVKSTQAELEHIIRPVTTGATATAGTSSSPSSSSTSSDKEFSARLTGGKEVPPVDTDATGRIRLAAKSQDALDYQISLSNLNGVVTGAHIHRGSTGTNGPVVANLNIGGAFASASAGDGSASASTSSGGTTTSSDLKGPLAGKHVSDLIKLIEDGNAYANVHTRQHPNGEIRGQLSSSSSSDVDNGISASSSGGASATASATAH